MKVDYAICETYHSVLIKLQISLNKTFFVERVKVLCKHLKPAL